MPSPQEPGRESRRQVSVGWLYPAQMNIYGDRGNVLALAQRARWRGLTARVVNVGIGEPLPADIDIYFFGGGQDQLQGPVAEDLQRAKGQQLKEAVAGGAGVLAICGGFQLLGNEYRPHDGAPLAGVGLFDVVTHAGADRLIGNVTVDSRWGKVVGFENHSGRTYLGDGVEPMGRILVGSGNNGTDGTEGAVIGHAVGSYLHGSLLPKNPRLTDWLLLNALRRRNPGLTLDPLDDTFETAAHHTAVTRAEAGRS